MRLSHRRAPLLLGFLLTACNAGAAATTTSSLAAGTTSPVVATTGLPTSTTVVINTTSTVLQPDAITIFISPFATQMGEGWQEQLFPYGDEVGRLGTSPGGDGLMLGPEYGAQMADGSWWFLDAAKLRLAHFDDDAAFVDSVEMPANLLVNGQYFQYQMPQALDNGRLVAHGFRGEDSTALLLLADGAISGRNITASISWANSDGTYLYGLETGDGEPRRLEPENGNVEEVDWLLARDGSRYMVRVDQDRLIVERPDAGITKTLTMRFSEEEETPVRGGIEVETGVDGTLFILIYGAPASDETFGVGGLVTVTPSGFVSEAERIVTPFSSADPGSPAHLGVQPGTSTPWIMVVGDDGVHVHSFRG